MFLGHPLTKFFAQRTKRKYKSLLLLNVFPYCYYFYVINNGYYFLDMNRQNFQTVKNNVLAFNVTKYLFTTNHIFYYTKYVYICMLFIEIHMWPKKKNKGKIEMCQINMMII